MNVLKDELVAQMESVAHHLTDHNDTRELGEMIKTWALAVEELRDDECEECDGLRTTISDAVSDAKAHNPIGK